MKTLHWVAYTSAFGTLDLRTMTIPHASALIRAVLISALEEGHRARSGTSSRAGPGWRSVPPVLHLLASEPRFGLERVMCPAAQLEIRSITGTANGEWDDVMKFEKTALRAAAECADERAAPFIARPHFSLHGCCDVTRARRGPSGRSRRLRSRAPLALEVGHQ